MRGVLHPQRLASGRVAARDTPQVEALVVRDGVGEADLGVGALQLGEGLGRAGPGQVAAALGDRDLEDRAGGEHEAGAVAALRIEPLGLPRLGRLVPAAELPLEAEVEQDLQRLELPGPLALL